MVGKGMCRKSEKSRPTSLMGWSGLEKAKQNDASQEPLAIENCLDCKGREAVERGEAAGVVGLSYKAP